MRKTLGLSVAALLAACGAEGGVHGQQGEVSEARRPLYGEWYGVGDGWNASDLTSESILANTVSIHWRGAQAGDGDINLSDTHHCTGVLVNASTVLTAARCATASNFSNAEVCAWMTNGITSDGGLINWPQACSMVASFVSHPLYQGYENDVHDIAVVYLQDAIPPNIVQNFAPVFLGNIDRAIRSGALRPVPALVAGFGLACHDPDPFLDETYLPCGYATRYGYVRGVEVSHRAGSAVLSNIPDVSVESALSRGDTGGPIFMREASGTYRVVGIALEGSSSGVYDYWALTGMGDGDTGIPNNVFVAGLLGDLDHDLVGDSPDDNCPPLRCALTNRPMTDCYNPDQTDLDDDGVGDACDNCPPAICAAIDSNTHYAGRFSCHNPAGPGIGLQADADFDGLGDTCDLCPEKAAPHPDVQHWDDDGDLVGNECEASCAMDVPEGRSEVPFAFCSSSWECPSSRGMEPRCISYTEADGITKGGRCAQLPDWDGDGVLDSCDNCASVYNIDQANANFWAEVAEYHSTPPIRRGDACDPVPMFLLETQWTESALGPQPPPGQGPSLSDTAYIRGRSWLANTAEVRLGHAISETLTFRYCYCYDEHDQPLPPGECARRSECEGLATGGNWTDDLEVKAVPGNSHADLDQVFEKGKLGAEDHPDPDEYSWEWYPLTQPGPGGEDPLIRSHTVAGERRIRGLVGAIVSYDAGITVSNPDKNAGGRLRRTMVEYDLPKWKVKEVITPPIEGPRRCLFGCFYWLRWWETLVNPSPIEDFLDRSDRVARLAFGPEGPQLQFRQGEALDATVNVSSALSGVLLTGTSSGSRIAAAAVGPESEGVAAATPESGSVADMATAESGSGSELASANSNSVPDIAPAGPGSEVEPDLVAAAADPELGFEASASGSEQGGAGPWAWVGASEPGLVLAERNVTPVSILVPREGSTVARPLVVRYGGEGIVLENDEFEELPEGASTVAAVQLPAGGAAAFSAIENAIYIAGGAGYGNEGILRRYDLSSGAWDANLPVEYAPSVDVRGVAFDVGSGLLYVLDVENGQARIVAHRFDTREARLLWAAPLESGDAWLGFGINGAGNLVLVRSFSGNFTAWLSNIDDLGDFHIDRAFDGDGEVFDHPVMGHRELLLPVREGDETYRLVPLWPQRFDQENPCVSL